MTTLLEIAQFHDEVMLKEEFSLDRTICYQYIAEATVISEEDAAILIESIKSYMKKDYAQTKKDFQKMKDKIKEDWKNSFRLAKGDAVKIARAKKSYRKSMNAADKWFKTQMKTIWKKGNQRYKIILPKVKKA